MNYDNPILTELQGISPHLANVSRKEPYQAPDGYFEGLEEVILQRIENQGLPGKRSTYIVPDHYFEGLASQVLKRIKASEAESSNEELEILSPLLRNVGREMPYSRPEGYFEELADGVVAGTRAIEFVNEELENLPELLLSLRKKEVYQVPADFFESFPHKVIASIRARSGARVVSMGTRLKRLAVAALVAGVVVTAGLLFLNSPTSDVAGSTAQITVESLSEGEIEQYLQSTPPVAEEIFITASAEMDGEDVKAMFAGFSDDELNHYMSHYTPVVNN